jgi:hypothetical protein
VVIHLVKSQFLNQFYEYFEPYLDGFLLARFTSPQQTSAPIAVAIARCQHMATTTARLLLLLQQ